MTGGGLRWRGAVDYWIAHRLWLPKSVRRRVCDWYENWLEGPWQASRNGGPPPTPERSAE